MTTLRQAAQQALEAMDNLHRTGDTQVFDLCHRETTEALRAALAEQNKCTHGADDSCKECYMAAHKTEVAIAEAYRCGYEAGVVAERDSILKQIAVVHDALSLGAVSSTLKARGKE